MMGGNNSEEDKERMPVSPQHDYTTIISTGGWKENFWNYVERVTGERSLRKFLWQGLIFNLFSGFPTIVGSVLRGKVYKKVLGGVGSKCLIEKGVRFIGPQRIFLGDRVFIGEGSWLAARTLKGEIQIKDDVIISRQVIFKVSVGKIVINERAAIGERVIIRGSGGVKIGKDSLIANQVELIAANHVFKNPLIPIRLQGGEAKEIVIGEDVWLGAYVTVLSGVTIGDGSVVGAGSVVTKDIPSYSVAVGVPTKVIGKRE